MTNQTTEKEVRIAELEGQVAMLEDVLKRLPTRFDAGMPAYRIEVNAIIGRIAQTAEQYKRRVRADGIDKAADSWREGWGVHELRSMASELRARSTKGEG